MRELVAGDPLIASLTDCMLRARAALWQEYLRLHKLVIAIVRQDELCRRCMCIPGVGPISALAFKTAVDDPRRFLRSKTVGAYFGYDAATLAGAFAAMPYQHCLHHGLEGVGVGRDDLPQNRIVDAKVLVTDANYIDRWRS
jgi:hypothetical protein